MPWPDRLSERLEDEHIEGILAHELVHVRRHDNLTAAIHMLVEVIFWFHPMVWWIESRMLRNESVPVMRQSCSWQADRKSMPRAC